MKIKFISGALAIVPLLFVTAVGHAVDITATGSGNWSSTIPDAPWPGGVVPGTNDSVDVEAPFVITVDSNTTIGYIYGGGTVIMGAGVTLNVLGDSAGAYGTQQLDFFNATAAGNTVNYLGNAFWAKRTDYYHLTFNNTTTNSYDFYNGPIPGSGAVPMTIGGNLTMSGKVKVQQGADFTVGGNLFIGTNSTWDCSSYQLTVASNTFVNGLLLDLDGALGSNHFGGNVTVAATAVGWNVSDVIHWAVGGSLTNNGTIVGKGYGSIDFTGSGFIAGSKTLKLPTITVDGTYTVATSITLTTNTPTLNGTLIFDLIRTNQLVLLPGAGTPLFYSGNLQVINSGAPPASSASFKFFNAPGYDGAFASTTFPGLPGGLSWVDNLLTTGAIDVTGSVGSPVLGVAQSGGVLTLSWDSTAFPGYRVEAQTNSAGLGTNWSATGSGTVSPYVTAISLGNGAVFYRLIKP